MSDTDAQRRFLDESYELLGQLGGGAVGAVWLVRDRQSAAEYAIKILNPGLTADPGAREELRAVLEAVRGLRHPNIVAVDDVVAYQARVALVMRPVSGEDLTALLGRTGALAPAQAALLIAQVCDALAAAHEVNVAHGGVKPANVVLEPEPGDPLSLRAALTDFGVARLAATAGVTPLRDEIGRPFYAAMPVEYQAPEIGVGCISSPAADVYAVGVLLYEVLAGRVPFSGEPEEVRQLHMGMAPPRIAGLPDPMWSLIAACLSKEPQHRPSARDLAGLLREIAPTVQLIPQWVMRDAAVAPPHPGEGRQTGELALNFPARSVALLTAGAGGVDVGPTGAAAGRRTGFGTPRRAELAAVVGIIVLAFAATWLFSSIGSGPPGSATFAAVPTQQPSGTLPAGAGGAASGMATPSGSATASATATGSPTATATASRSASAAPSVSAASRSATPSAVASPSAAAPSPSPLPSQGSGGAGLPGGWVELVNAASGLVLDSGGGVPAGSRLKQWQYGGGPNLHWRLAYLGNGYYGLVNEANGMVADSAGATGNGATAVQSPWNGSANQQWSFVRAGRGFYHVVNRGTGTALDGDGQNQIGASTVLWAPNPSPNNEWGVSG